MKHFCTYFDSNYALRGLTLFRSMQEHCGEFVLHVLCCDDEAFAAVEALTIENLRAYRLSEVENFEPRLSQVKPTRTVVEYLWTLSPIWPLFLLETDSEVEMVCYLDADLFFFSGDEPIWQEFADSSILLIEHKFRPEIEFLSAGGRFNVGMMAFRRDKNGIACLKWYRERCLEWCFNRYEDGRYGDQKYLDEFPQRFDGVCILQNVGANVAPWNWMNEPIVQKGQGFSVGEVDMVFFHYHGLKMFNSWLFDPSTHDAGYGVMPDELVRILYQPYINALKRTAQWTREQNIILKWGYSAAKDYGWRFFLGKLRRRRFFIQRGMR